MPTDASPNSPTLPRSGQQVIAGTFRTLPVLLMSAGHFVHDVFTGFLPPLLPLFISKLSLSLAQAGFLTTVMQIPSLFNPMIGALADRTAVREPQGAGHELLHDRRRIGPGWGASR